MYRVAETAHKSEKRKTFHEMLDYARKNRAKVHGLLFYKVDRAARNMKDWIDLVDLRDKHGIEIVCITEPFDETPAGKLNSNMLAAISQFYSDQLSQRTQAGVERRVQTGLFPGHAPYGYQNFREGGRGLVKVEEREADNVRRIFELYAYHNHTLEMVVETMAAEGRYYRKHRASFKRSKVHRYSMTVPTSAKSSFAVGGTPASTSLSSPTPFLNAFKRFWANAPTSAMIPCTATT
jgi:DNA invertase Pin-like site-specific DNA recombinase